MDDRYLPPSDFLQTIIADEVPLSGGEHGEANVRRLIEMTRDEHQANRDWATFLLAQQNIDTPEVRAALATPQMTRMNASGRKQFWVWLNVTSPLRCRSFKESWRGSLSRCPFSRQRLSSRMLH